MENVVEQVKPEVQEAVEEQSSKVQEALHRVVLAALGTVGLVQDELEHFVNKAVERGQIAEKDARQVVNQATERRKGATKEVDKRMEDMLSKLNIPTKMDIDLLNEKISELSKKVESLKN